MLFRILNEIFKTAKTPGFWAFQMVVVSVWFVSNLWKGEFASMTMDVILAIIYFCLYRIHGGR